MTSRWAPATKQSTAALALAAAAAALAAYLPVLGLGFVWDDHPLYLDLPALRDWSSLPAGILGTVVTDLHFFRPLALLSFKLQFLLFGDSSTAAHAINLALHACNTFLVTALALRVSAPLAGAGLRGLAAGLLYGLHPALIEPVAWMSCRFDLMVTLCLLLALHADFAIAGRGARAVTVAALYALALCSKEMAAPFPAVLALFQLATRYREVSWRELPRRFVGAETPLYALLLLVGSAYVAVRAAYIGGAVDSDPDVVAALGSVMAHAAFVASTLLFHAAKVLWPFGGLNPLHPVDLAALATLTPRDALDLAGAGTLLAVLGYGIWRRLTLLVLLAAATLALFPVLNVLPLSIGRNLGHERYLTFPLSLVALALACCPFPAAGSPRFRVAAIGAGAVALAWAGAAVANIRVTLPLWRSDVTLWSWAASQNPQSDYAHHQRVMALIHAGRLDLAQAEVTEAAPTTPYRALTELELAHALLESGAQAPGAEHLRRALQGFPAWHREPPRSASDLRDFKVYRGYIARGYHELSLIEATAGQEPEAQRDAVLAEQYLGAGS